jgi:ribosome-associated heat shock protein Hsp15
VKIIVERHDKTQSPDPTQRLDKWLKIARIFKTRDLAAQACELRHVKVNNKAAKPAKMIKASDQITVKMKNGRYVNLAVLGVSGKNVSAKDAKMLYEKKEIQLSEKSRELLELVEKAKITYKPKYKGRPTKKERRKLEKLKKKPLF